MLSYVYIMRQLTELESLENGFPLGNGPINKSDVDIEDSMGVRFQP